MAVSPTPAAPCSTTSWDQQASKAPRGAPRPGVVSPPGGAGIVNVAERGYGGALRHARRAAYVHGLDTLIPTAESYGNPGWAATPYRAIFSVLRSDPQIGSIFEKAEPDDAELLVKLEQFNAGGSVKDRIALNMVDKAERSGVLKPGMTIIESSSGNTAIGLAIISAVRGYKLVAICDRHLPLTKRLKLRAYGAHVVFLPDTPEGFDTVELRIEISKRLSGRIPGSITLLQYDNLTNREAHYFTTGQEILSDVGGHLDACVVPMGTCGSVSGIGRALKDHDARIKVYGVEPRGSVLFGGEPAYYLVQGGGLSFIPKNLDRSVIDAGIKVADADSFTTARLLSLREGLMLGGSGAMAVFVGLRLTREMGRGRKVVVMAPDSGDRYIDSIYSDDWLRSHQVPTKSFETEAEPEVSEAAAAEGCSVNSF
jgi:cysteine synthase